MTGADYVEALSPARAPVDLLLKEVAQIWKTLGLSPQAAADRISDLVSRLEDATQPLLEAERASLDKAQGELATVREDATAMANEVGEELRVPETLPVLEQIEELQKERVRLEPFRERRAEELRELMLRISRECQWMGVDESQYAVPEGTTGFPGVRAAKQRLGRLEALQEGRVVEAGKARARIKSMQEELGGPLEFRVAHEGELTGSDDGVVVLERNAVNERFVREVAEFEEATRREVVASGRFEAHIQRLEEQYIAEVKARRHRRRRKKENGGRSPSEGSEPSMASQEDDDRQSGLRSRSPLVWRRRGEDGGRPRGPGPDAPRGPRGRMPDRNHHGRPPRDCSESRSPSDGPPPLPRRRRDEAGRHPDTVGRERPPRQGRRRMEEEEAESRPPERRPPRGGAESRETSAENGRWHWRAPADTSRRGNAWQSGPDGSRDGVDRGEGGGRGRLKPPRRDPDGRPPASLRRPERRRGPPMENPPLAAESRSRSPRQGPPPRGGREREREMCRVGLDEMQGEWIDKGGEATYVVSGRAIKRDDGRKFSLNFIRGAIGWGPNGNYYVVPDVSLEEEVRWLSADTGRTAFVWERPDSPVSVRSRGDREGGRGAGGGAPVLQ